MAHVLKRQLSSEFAVIKNTYSVDINLTFVVEMSAVIKRVDCTNA